MKKHCTMKFGYNETFLYKGLAKLLLFLCLCK